MSISKDAIIGDLIREHPEAIEVLLNNGLACIGCPASQMETLEEAAMVHGLDLEKLLTELNA